MKENHVDWSYYITPRSSKIKALIFNTAQCTCWLLRSRSTYIKAGIVLLPYALCVLAGTRLTLKTGVKTLGGRISFLPQSLPVKKIITYLIRVLDTSW